MFAVIRTGGKQYRVAPNDIIKVERIQAKPGEIVELGDVLLLGGDGAAQTGEPTITGAAVAAEVVEQMRGDKIIVFKKRRRKNYRRTRGHRQMLTLLRITEILTDGKKPSKVAKKAEPKAPLKKIEPKKPQPKKAEVAPKAKKAAKAPAKKPAVKKAAVKKAAAKKPAAKKTETKKPRAAAKPKAKK